MKRLTGTQKGVDRQIGRQIDRQKETDRQGVCERGSSIIKRIE